MLPDKLPYILPFPHWVLVPAPIHCDGDVVVIHDLVGAFPWFIPAFVKPRADVAGEHDCRRQGVDGRLLYGPRFHQLIIIDFLCWYFLRAGFPTVIRTGRK